MWCVFSPITLTWIAAPSVSRQRAEEMRHELGGEAAHLRARELAFEHGIGTAGQVDGHLHARLVHGQQEAVARDAALVAQCLAQRAAQRQRAVFHGVVFVHLAGRPCSAAAARSRRAWRAAPACDRRRRDRWRSRWATLGVEIERDRDAGFLRARASAWRGATAARARWRATFPDCEPVVLHAQAPHAEVLRELQVRQPVADHRAAREVDRLVAAR